jgi:large subunit ribosomal protein L21
MSYAIISLGGKQYTVREGQRLLVDRVAHGAGETFTPVVLLSGGNGETSLSPSDVTVTVRVVGDRLGEKIRIGKYRPKNGYRKHTGFRAKLSQIEIESIAKKGKAAPKKEAPAKAEAPKAETPTAEAPTAEAPTVDAPKAAAEKAAEPVAERPKGMPSGYEELTVVQIKEQAPSWRRPQLEAALEYEQANAARKGALAALNSALAEKEED